MTADTVPVVDRLPSINDAALVALIIAAVLSIPLHTFMSMSPQGGEAGEPVLDICHTPPPAQPTGSCPKPGQGRCV